jgi:hypothetical protein
LGGNVATAIAVAAKTMLSKRCTLVGGVSGRPKQPHVARVPPCRLAYATTQTNTTKEAATKLAVKGPGKSSAVVPSAASRAAPTLTARRMNFRDGARESGPGNKRINARAVSSGRAAFAAPAIARSPEATRKIPISSIAALALRSQQSWD